MYLGNHKRTNIHRQIQYISHGRYRILNKIHILKVHVYAPQVVVCIYYTFVSYDGVLVCEHRFCIYIYVQDACYVHKTKDIFRNWVNRSSTTTTKTRRGNDDEKKLTLPQARLAVNVLFRCFVPHFCLQNSSSHT